jgi:hypothetical protein
MGAHTAALGTYRCISSGHCRRRRAASHGLSRRAFAGLRGNASPARNDAGTPRRDRLRTTGHLWEAVAHVLAEHGVGYVLVNRCEDCCDAAEPTLQPVERRQHEGE